ncbi:MAG TPA: LacI family transcriptional regulator, partial [Firmicutes bacterium]|nr:LacI family transcriptional regulator [Bacillota bacterium]
KAYPTISSIKNPAYEQGKQAGKMIIEIINSGSKIPGINLNTEFIVRGKFL